MDNVRPFGTASSGEEVFAVSLDSGEISCEIITFGAAIRTLSAADRNGARRDVVLGYDTLREYETMDGYLGAVVGRYANRIAKGRFELNGKTYTLAANNGENHLHGGLCGFSNRVWAIESVGADALTLTLAAADGEEGYPANMRVRVTYSLVGASLRIRYEAVSDADTVCNLTNHAYFNLSGHGSGTVYAQEIMINAAAYTPTDGALIPTGEIAGVAGTPMDLREFTAIGAHINDAFPQLRLAGGYDHNFVLDGMSGVLHTAARARSGESGITMTVETTLPGIQFYSSNFLNDGRTGKAGCVYGQHHGFCLETQFFPDSPNRPEFPSVLLRAGERYDHTSVFTFSAE